MSRVLKNQEHQITNHYGNGHTGVDVVGKGGTIDIVVAHSAGKVIFCQTGQPFNPGSTGNASYGNCVKIKHDNGMFTLYAHLGDVRVRQGQYVEKGQDLGIMGNTGNSYGAHLHFEVWNKQNSRINPESYLNSNLDGNVDCTGIIQYQIYANNRWYEEVRKADNTAEGYAGDGVNYISGVRAKPEYGEIFIQSHQLNGSWLAEISSAKYEKNNTSDGNSYSGIYGQPIDKIKFRSTKGFVDARALTAKGWLPWVRFYDKFTDDYIGNEGEPILGLQIV